MKGLVTSNYNVKFLIAKPTLTLAPHISNPNLILNTVLHCYDILNVFKDKEVVVQQYI